MSQAEEAGHVFEARKDLTNREVEVLALIANGLSNARTASKLGVTTHAVKFHLASIYRKLAVANRTEATAVYWRDLHAQRGEAETWI